MYIPHYYKSEDRQEAIAFMKRFNFGVLIAQKDSRPIASHLPFCVFERDNKIILNAHLAAANEQGKLLNDQECLVIFSEPHAYISPTHYNSEQNVPTWNYLSVHAYGRPQLLEEKAEKEKVLMEMIDLMEPSYAVQWESLSEKYKTAMMNGIIAFEMEIEELQFKKKLSQNKKEDEKKRIIHTLEDSNDSTERTTADYMKKIEK